MSDNPMEAKRNAEARAKICRQEIEKLRNARNDLKAPQIAVYRPEYGMEKPRDVQLVNIKALHAFLIQNLEAEALRYEREANRLRFEVIKWAEGQREAMQAEIAAFNAGRLS
jgi:hypothetical protein